MDAGSTTAAGGMVRRFSTSAVDPARRLDYWNRLAGESSTGLSVDSSNRAYDGQMERWTIGDLILMRVAGEASRVHRTPPHGKSERIRVHLQLKGVCRQSHLGREAVLRAGDLSVCTSTAAARIEAGRHEMLVLDVGRETLGPRAKGLEDRYGRPTMATAPAVHSFAQTALAMWREARVMEPAGHEDWAAECGVILLDLLGLALRSPAAPRRAALLPIERMKAIVDARLGEPELNAGMIAADMGVSIRTVQLGFAGQRTTPGDYIRLRRLDRALERLTTGDGSITEIAFDLGFNDSAYFSRCFRQTYGVSPREWRMGQRGG